MHASAGSLWVFLRPPSRSAVISCDWLSYPVGCPETRALSNTQRSPSWPYLFPRPITPNVYGLFVIAAAHACRTAYACCETVAMFCRHARLHGKTNERSSYRRRRGIARRAISVKILSAAVHLYEKSDSKRFAIGEWLYSSLRFVGLLLYYDRPYHFLLVISSSSLTASLFYTVFEILLFLQCMWLPVTLASFFQFQ